MPDFTKPVLALDSALGGCVVAVLHDGRAFTRSLETGRDQAAKLMPMVQDVMAESGVEFSALGLIVTTIGPGSFTGLRIGLSAARALGLALSVPVQGISTFEAMARSCAPSGPSLVLLESKRSDFYVQAFDGDFKTEGAAQCLLAQDVSLDRIVCGDAMARLRSETGLAFAHAIERVLPDPLVLAQTGLEAFAAHGFKAVKPEPVYLRGADVSLSNKAQRQINNYPAQ